MTSKQIVIATGNAGKIREIRALYGDLPVEWIPVSQLGAYPDIAETGESFFENALLKAQGISEWAGLPTLADDSGLAVDFLNGAPGVYSARFSGPSATDESNTQLLLSKLDGVPDGQRTARFHATIVAWWGADDYERADGTCEGHIIGEPRGESGFGYDPVFVPDGETETFAQLGAEVKNGMSHRSRALEKLRGALQRRIGV